MAKYLLVYHGGGMPEGQEATRPGDGGVGDMVREPRSRACGRRQPDLADQDSRRGRSVSDGGGANAATGYSLIQAESLEAAVTLAKGCPVLQGGATIEVAETFDM